MPPTKSCVRACRNQGVALVIVLIFSVLLSGLVVAYFSRATTVRQLSNSSFNQNKADQFARSAADIIIGGLKQEIADPNNSTVSGSAPYTVYVPKSAAQLLPGRSYPGLTNDSDPIPNLVRISSHTNNPPAPAISSSASAINSETAVSANGRYITRARWNKHFLVPQLSTENATDTTPISSFTSPDWVMVTNQGPTVLTAPNSSVIGRYAYAIYDEGGLLDVNVAGYPTNATADQFGGKPALAYADLTQLGNAGFKSEVVNTLVGWRNYASTQPGGAFGGFTFTTTTQAQNFFNLVTGNLFGFLRASTAVWNGSTDQAFVSRQELINYAQSAQWGTAMPNLQYLSTFSRSLNTPTWRPSTPLGSTIDYAGQKDSSGVANRDLGDGEIVVTKQFTRADGSQALVGEPLIKSRFPLSRLAGLGYNGIVTSGNTTLLDGMASPASTATIQRDFGLIWNTAPSPHWDYCGPTGQTLQTSIATLDAIGNREPNFFELLKAGILKGSLGRDAGKNGTFYQNYEEGPASGIQSDAQNVDYQIIQIGANIIDQSDADSYPTEIHFHDANTAFYGIENLPYLQRVFAKTLYPVTDPKTKIKYLNGYYMAEVWNPHGTSGTTAATTPVNFRFLGQGLTEMWCENPGPSDTPYEPGPPTDLSASGHIDFQASASATLREPTLVSNDNGFTHVVPVIVSGTNGSDDPYGNGSPSGGTIAGLFAGSIVPINPDYGGIAPYRCNLVLQYKSATGDYRTYQVMKSLTALQQASANNFAYYYQHSDPRSDRFGTTLGRWSYPPNLPPYYQPGLSTRPGTGSSPDWSGYDYFPARASSFQYANASNAQTFNNFFMGDLSDNTSSSNPHYNDIDGVLRSAEGAYASGMYGRPMYQNQAANPPTSLPENRPLILNRPFRNVGELGYAYRDEPWKNIDFFTANSADSALLDIFCTQETIAANAITAGKISLNTRQAPVLQAVLAGAMMAEDTSTIMAASDASTIASHLVAYTTGASTGGTPFLNRSDLVNKAAAVFIGSNTIDQQIKRRREAGLRALSESGDTRTWNLMIDVIAQTGRYAPGQSNLKKFFVEGEKRYWVHVAIDRYTGAIIDQAVEPVYE